jgi:ligand-binding sensor domain-containing protein/signal transduction histidine kinase
MLRLCILLCLVPAVIQAQQNIRLEQILVKDGLSQADIKCILQDNDGFLWIGTRDGLNKYDGNKFTHYGGRFNDPTALYFNQILDLKPDPNGNIWIASVGGISCYERNSDTFHNYLFPEAESTTRVNTLFVASAETIMLSTNQGMMRFNVAQKDFTRDVEYSVASQSHVKQFYSEAGAGTWIATTKGLYIKRPGNDGWNILFGESSVHHLNRVANTFFISTGQGLYAYDLTDNSIRQIDLPFSWRSVFQSLATDTGELWVASDRVAVFDLASLSLKHTISREENNNASLTEDRARILYQSKDGMIWIGTFGYGLNKHDPNTKNFRYLGVKSSIPLSSNYISTILTEDDTTLFIGTSRGLNVVDLGKKTNQYHFKGDDMALVFRVKKDQSGRIWIASSKGVYQYENGKLFPLNFHEHDIPDFAEWDTNTFLMATHHHGLYLVNKNNEGVKQLVPPGIVKEVSTIFLRKDLIWVGSQDGLRVLSKDGQLVKHFKSQANNRSSLHSDVIKCIVEDKAGNLWIGTWGGGLSRYNEVDGTFTTFDQDNGLPNSTVYGIIEDSQGLLWLTTNLGISRFDPREITFENFDYESGLQGNEFNTGAYFKSANDIIYLGGTDGVTFFDPRSISRDTRSPSVFITDISINSIPVAKDQYANSINSKDELQLTWTRTNVGIGFTAVDYRNPDKIIFQFSVDDDTTWSTIENRRNLELVDLSPGRHTLHLRAKKFGGHWGQPTTLAMYVNPAFWKTTSFIIFLSALMIVGAYLFYRIRVKYLKRLNLRLQKLVEDRTSEIQLKNEEISAQNEALTSSKEKLARLNDKLEQKISERTKSIQQLNTDLQEQNKQLEQFSFITAHNFRGPLARIKGLINLIGTEPKENLGQVVSYLKLSADNLDEVIQDLNKILEIKKEGETQLQTVELLPELKMALSIAEADLASKKIRVDISDFASRSIVGHKSYVQSIFSNLLVNSIKYADSTRASFIKVSCVIEGDRVRIDFADNGIGFDLGLASSKLFMPYQRFNESHSGRGLGLYIVKTQVTLMKGEITVESHPGIGSTFRMYFPSRDLNIK